MIEEHFCQYHSCISLKRVVLLSHIVPTYQNISIKYHLVDSSYRISNIQIFLPKSQVPKSLFKRTNTSTIPYFLLGHLFTPQLLVLIRLGVWREAGKMHSIYYFREDFQKEILGTSVFHSRFTVYLVGRLPFSSQPIYTNLISAIKTLSSRF